MPLGLSVPVPKLVIGISVPKTELILGRTPLQRD